MHRTADGPALRVGVLGCAGIAWRNTLPAVLRVPEVRLTALASRDPAKARTFADRFGGTPVEGYDRLLTRDDVDAVYVALPTGLHHHWARRALLAGKHVWAEKPLAATAEQAEDLVRLARANGLVLRDNFMFLHHSQHAVVARVIAEGRIGEPRSFSSAFGIPPRPDDDVRLSAELGGGALLDVGVYTVRAAQLLLGDDLTVAGSVLRVDRARGVDLAGSALLHTPDGRTAALAFGFDRAYRSTYAVWGSEGRLSLDRAFTPPATHRPLLRIERQDHHEELSLAPDDQFAQLVRAFAAAVREKRDHRPYEETLLRHAALTDSIREGARLVAG
ncbi:oxidoreductase [Streptomyces lucensis JCM 4490]|uniref:Oxidoreductase n=1 Tax=Streptomyces lucensis JCM 4490 TaxID=1306176 RepID=A0A918J790_9ACTN|nr:Gfo/Idh/MocA family oxidoreductase [Streptomyces lucensis]GGW54649.1 oxidoreductase [Streptomyces lucensis JCM 4490]